MIMHYFVNSLVSVLLFGNAISSFASFQNLPITYYNTEMKSYVCKGKITDIDSLLDSLQHNTIEDTALLACCYHQIGVYYFNEKIDFIKSASYNKLAIELRNQFDDGLLWKSYKNMGVCYKKLQKYKEASNLFELALNSYIEDDKYQVILLKNLAEVLSETGEYHRAKSLLRQAIKIGKANNINRNEIARAHCAMAKIINDKDSLNFNDAINHSKKSLEFSTKNKTEIAALTQLGNAYKHKGDYFNALNQYEKVFSKQNNKLYKAITLNNIASANEGLKKYEKSTKIFYKALKLKLAYFNYQEYNYNYSVNFNNIAFNYNIIEQFDSALINCQKAIINLTDSFRNEDFFSNPNAKDTSLFTYSNSDMIGVLHLKANAAYKYFQQNKDEKYLALADQTYQTALDFHDKLQKDISTENSRLFQAKNILPYIENALNTSYQQQKNGQDIGKSAFRFMEKNKATVLRQSMNEADALQFANLSDSLIEQEKDLKTVISFYERQLNEPRLYEDTITVINEIESILLENKEKYRRLINNLEENHPDYYHLKYQQNQTKLTNVQNELDDQTALLSYFAGDSSIYTLLILKDSTQLFKTPKSTNWEKVINDFRETISLSNPEDRFNKYNKKSFKNFITNAHTLYQNLLQKPLKELHHISHLKIIPDAELNYIPFDLLLTNSINTTTVDYKNLPYLLKQKTISYAYSAALMLEQQQEGPTEKQYTYSGYAPKYDNSTLSDLPKARQLVNDMASFFKGKKHLNKAATKASFLNDTLIYQISHLAMHGKLNDKYPLNSQLVFSKPTAKSKEEDYKLYAADLYNHQLNADLTILNACETGTGKLRKGEGVMSLSRAFTYAGCPSLLMSLWSIDEQPSADILDTFLKSIKKGRSKDVALQQAKLNYLDNTSANFSHPYYWAGLVLTGNTKAMEFKSHLSDFWWIWMLVLLLILSGGYWVFKNLIK